MLMRRTSSLLASVSNRLGGSSVVGVSRNTNINRSTALVVRQQVQPQQQYQQQEYYNCHTRLFSSLIGDQQQQQQQNLLGTTSTTSTSNQTRLQQTIQRRLFITTHQANNNNVSNNNKPSNNENNNENNNKNNKQSIDLSLLLSEDQNKRNTSLSTAVRIKETAKDGGYLVVILLGVGAFCAMMYAIYEVMFGGDSEYKLFKSAKTVVEHDMQVVRAIGDSLKAYGERNKRGRHVGVRHQIHYDEQATKRMLIMFYVQGSLGVGDVIADFAKHGSKWELMELHVQVRATGETLHLVTDGMASL